jgi:hypothetical protein
VVWWCGCVVVWRCGGVAMWWRGGVCAVHAMCAASLPFMAEYYDYLKLQIWRQQDTRVFLTVIQQVGSASQLAIPRVISCSSLHFRVPLVTTLCASHHAPWALCLHAALTLRRAFDRHFLRQVWDMGEGGGWLQVGDPQIEGPVYHLLCLGV